MTRVELQEILNYMRTVYLPFWYSRTVPLSDNGSRHVAEEFRVSEKLVQALWNDGKCLNEKLIDLEGRVLRIISPGRWNREAGPDFKNARIEMDGHVVHGDVEMHLLPENWNSHGHQFDPNYNNVVLHVVWEKKHQRHIPAHIPLLELKEQLSVPCEKIWDITQLFNYPKGRMHPAADCSESIGQISDEQLTLVFRAAGLSRLQRKCAQFKLNVLKFGLEQAFFMGLAEAHGFKNNRLPFLQLVHDAPIERLQKLKGVERRALLWGLSNLLPDSTQVNIAPGLLDESRLLWANWWPLRSDAEQMISWNRSSLRPFNSPERRLAALICLLEKCDYGLVKVLQKAQKHLSRPKELREYISELFQFDSPWSAYCNFKTELKRPCRLMGSSRTMDIMVNVFIPALAALDDDGEHSEDLYHFYCSLPKCQDNHSLDIARHRFFLPPVRMKRIIRKAVDQQGLIQLLQDYELPGTPDAVVSFWRELGIPVGELNKVEI